MAKGDPLKAAVDVLKKRVSSAALDVASPQFCRAYWRAHPHKLMDFVTDQFPKQLAGTGEDGSHMVTVVHAFRPTALDGPQAPVLVEGQTLSVDGVEVSRG